MVLVQMNFKFTFKDLQRENCELQVVTHLELDGEAIYVKSVDLDKNQSKRL